MPKCINHYQFFAIEATSKEVVLFYDHGLALLRLPRRDHQQPFRCHDCHPNIDWKIVRPPRMDSYMLQDNANFSHFLATRTGRDEFRSIFGDVSAVLSSTIRNEEEIGNPFYGTDSGRNPPRNAVRKRCRHFLPGTRHVRVCCSRSSEVVRQPQALCNRQMKL